MDVGALRASPIGRLVPIAGIDWRTGSPYEYFAYVPDRLPDALRLADATREAVGDAGDRLARFDRIVRRLGRAGTARDLLGSLYEPGATATQARDWGRGEPLTAGLVNGLQAVLVRGTRGD